MIVRLSHRLDGAQPNWPDAPGLHLAAHDQLDNGDIANTHVLTVYSHYGSHVDLPYHFLADGSRMADYDLRDFHFTHPIVVDVPLAEDDLLTADTITANTTTVAGADLVLFRSGFEGARHDLRRYSTRGPGISAAAAHAIRRHWPSVRAIGIDWLSVCAHAHVDEGVSAHQILLRRDDQAREVLIFEDLRLSALKGQTPKQVWAFPLLVDDLDASPCTIAAEVSQ